MLALAWLADHSGQENVAYPQGDSIHHEDQSITPASLSTMSVSEKTAHTPQARFQPRPAIDSGRLTRTPYTMSLKRCPLSLGPGSVSNPHHPCSEGTFRVEAPRKYFIHAVDGD